MDKLLLSNFKVYNPNKKVLTLFKRRLNHTLIYLVLLIV